ncbi:iron-containing alcohol dehydrogenase, partial [bacterium]|nr:iron-containing alcohol dehydrogenase [bacterium]
MPMFLRKLIHTLYLALMKVAVNFAPSARHTAFAGSGSSRHLCNHIVQMGVKKVLVVTDKPLRELGVVDQAIAGLQASDVDIAYYDGVQPDPTYDQVAAGVAVLKQHGSEVVLAIGGGSSI